MPSHRAQSTLPRTLKTLEAAAAGLDVETVVVEDVDGRGPSWARNRGLDRASGDVVFFCDADDAVRPGFFRRPMEAIGRTGAELCFFSYPGGPRLEEGVLHGVEAVRERYLPAFFGYSFDDVRRWNAGGRLMAAKELGQVWRCAYRRSFLLEHGIRFDEEMSFFEDAAFLSQCVAFAQCVASMPDELYEYSQTPGGNLASGINSRRHWDYKFLSLAFRTRLDAATGGEVGRFCEASHVFSAMEMLTLWRKAGLSLGEFRRGLAEYLANPVVAKAARGFPLSLRHPLVAAAVLFLRILTMKAPSPQRGT